MGKPILPVPVAQYTFFIPWNWQYSVKNRESQPALLFKSTTVSIFAKYMRNLPSALKAALTKPLQTIYML